MKLTNREEEIRKHKIDSSERDGRNKHQRPVKSQKRPRSIRRMGRH